MSLGSMRAAVAALRPRLGQFVPCQKIEEHRVPANWGFQHNGIRCSFAYDEDPVRFQTMKDFLWKVFYREAPIPVALGLSSAPATSKRRQQVEKELDFYLRSGLSVDFVRESDGETVGVGLCAYFPYDPHYEVLGLPLAVWHNAAAHISQEVCPEDPAAVWRDYQFQHFYDISQRVLRQEGAPGKVNFVYYFGVLAMNPEMRKSGLSSALFKGLASSSYFNDCVTVTQSNFSAFDGFLRQHAKGIRLEDEMLYKDIQLTVNNEQVFKKVAHIGRIRFFSAYLFQSQNNK